MALKAITKSDTDTLITQCGFQPSAIYVATAGDLSVHTRAGDNFTITVGDGTWFPVDDIVLIKAATTASGIVARR